MRFCNGQHEPLAEVRLDKVYLDLARHCHRTRRASRRFDQALCEVLRHPAEAAQTTAALA